MEIYSEYTTRNYTNDTLVVALMVDGYAIDDIKFERRGNKVRVGRKWGTAQDAEAAAKKAFSE